MKRPSLSLATACLCVLLGWGCGGYDFRLEKTLERLREKARLDQYLDPAVESKFKEQIIYLRTPKPLPQQPGDFSLFQGVPAGAFDIQSSFLALQPDAKLSLGCHVLARHKKPPAANTKGAPNPPAEAQRGPFNSDVVDLLTKAHNVPLSEADAKPITVKGKSYRRLAYKVGDNTIQAYLYNQKSGNESYDVALIWEIPPDQIKATSTPIDLAMQSFAVGRTAARLFETGIGDEESPGSEGAAF